MKHIMNALNNADIIIKYMYALSDVLKIITNALTVIGICVKHDGSDASSSADYGL